MKWLLSSFGHNAPLIFVAGLLTLSADLSAQPSVANSNRNAGVPSLEGAAIVLGTSVARPVASVVPQTNVIELTLRETVLCSIDAKVADQGQVVISEDCRHVAYPILDSGRYLICRDGVADPVAASIGQIALSPDGSRLAFVSKIGPGEKMVLDGRESEEFDLILTNSLAFSPDGGRFGFLAYKDRRLRAVIQGERRGLDTFRPRWSPLVTVEEDRALLRFSPDGEHVAYIAELAGTTLPNSRWCVMLDGRTGPPCEGIGVGSMRFSFDGRRLAYCASRGRIRLLVVDGAIVAQGDSESFNAIAFSPDSHRIAYNLQQGGKSRLHLDDQKGEEFDAFGKNSLRFSPDGRRLAYAVVDHGKWFVVVDGQKGRGFDSIGTWYSPLFSPDGRQLAFSAKRDGNWFVVIDDREGKSYRSIGSLTFSPDSRHLAYFALHQNAWKLVVDGQEGGGRYATVSPLHFDGADSLHFAANCHLEPGKHQMVLVQARVSDGQSTRTNSAPVSPRGQSREITWSSLQALLQEGRGLTSAQAETVEAELKRNPSDEAQWARLLGYYAGQATETNALPLARIEARIIEARPLSPLVDPASKSLFNRREP